MEPVLTTQSLGKAYGPNAILQNIDLTMDEGEFLVLVGPSGSGKSTLLSCIAGLTEITSGQLFIGGQDMTHVKPSDRNISMVFQSYALFPTMTVLGNITFGMKVRKVAKKIQQKRVKRVTEQLKISHLLDRRPGQLSGGQRQRVAMARALVREPRIFLFDEPLSNLDAKLRVSMRSEIKRLHRNMNASIVYVTHDQIEAMTLATRIVVLNDGEVQQVGTPDELYNHPANTFVADFMGSPSMNLIPGTVCMIDGTINVHIDCGEGQTVVFKDGTPPAGLSGAQDRPVIFGVRPEAIYEAGKKEAEALQIFQRPVDMVDPAGADTYVMTQLGGCDFTARLKAGTKVVAGDTFRFAVDTTYTSYFDPETGSRI
jgi:multiple sugar transport system ATP-binding protein